MGIALSLFTYQLESEPLKQLIIIILLLIGSLLPDIDEPKSLIGRHFKFLNDFFKHRGFFHSLTFVCLISIIIFSIDKIYSFAMFVGLMSHLLLDMLTKKGIKIPFKKDKIRGPIKVGSWKEKIIQVVLILFILSKFVSFTC